MTLAAGRVFRYRCRFTNPPKVKIGLCICPERKWFFWFNTDARSHGIAQLAADVNDCAGALTRACFLDMADVKAVSPAEMETLEDCGAISAEFCARVLEALAGPIKTLPDVHRQLASANLTAFGNSTG